MRGRRIWSKSVSALTRKIDAVIPNLASSRPPRSAGEIGALRAVRAAIAARQSAIMAMAMGHTGRMRADWKPVGGTARRGATSFTTVDLETDLDGEPPRSFP